MGVATSSMLGSLYDFTRGTPRMHPPPLAPLGTTILSTERLNLRTFCAADLPVCGALNADPEVMRYLGGPMSQAHSDAMLQGANHSFHTVRFGKTAVERRSDGALLGICGLSKEVWYPDDLEIGWRFARRFWGQGYATEAARAWLAYAFDMLHAPRVISITDVPNARSIAVMHRLGMRPDHIATLEAEDDTFEAVIYTLDRPTQTAPSHHPL